MRDLKYVHGINITQKIKKKNYPPILDEVYSKYLNWRTKTEKLNSENNQDLQKKVTLLNEYKNYVDSLLEKKIFKLQDKLASSVIEEFLFLLFKDIPYIDSYLKKGSIYIGQAKAYTDLAFTPKNLNDFVNNPGVYINRKNQDFTISKKVSCVFITNQSKEIEEIIVPAVAIECKTFIPSTMLGQASYEAQRLKQGNPYAIFIIVAEQNALSESINLKNLSIDEIFILRKQKRNAAKNKVSDKKPIDYHVVKELYTFVKKHLYNDWFNPAKATEKGKLINFD